MVVIELYILRIKNPICKDYAYYYDSSIERRIRWPKSQHSPEDRRKSRNLNRIFSLFSQIKPRSRIEWNEEIIHGSVNGTIKSRDGPTGWFGSVWLNRSDKHRVRSVLAKNSELRTVQQPFWIQEGFLPYKISKNWDFHEKFIF